MPKFEGDQEPEIDQIVKKEDIENKMSADLKQIIREIINFLTIIRQKYTDETLKSILHYLKVGKYPDSIESIRMSKKDNNKQWIYKEATTKNAAS